MGQMRKLALLAVLLPSVAMAQGLRAGVAVQLKCTSAAPTKVAANGEVWCDSTAGNALKYTTPGGSTSLLGGSATLAVTYTLGASQTDSTILYDSTRLGVRLWDNASPVSGNLFEIASASGTTKYLTSTTEGIALTSATFTSGTRAPVLKITAQSHTGLTAATEYKLLQVTGGGASIQVTGGGSWTQQAFSEFIAPTSLAATSATTIPDTYTLKVTGSVAPGTNMTITNRWVFGVSGGASLFNRDFSGPTNVGVLVQSRATASLGTQQPSPGLQISGNGWDTGASASRQADFSIVTNPVQGNPLTATLDIYSQINKVGWSSSLFSLSASKLTMSVPIYGSLGSTTIAPSWTSVTYQNSYVDYGLGGYAGSAYYKDANGIVHVRVAAKSGTATAAIFTLPAGYRPGGTRVVTAAVDGTFHNVTVSTAGVVQTDVGGNTFAICFIDFPAEN